MIRSKYRLKIIIFMVILICFGIIFAQRFSYINSKYPNPVLEKYKLNQKIEYNGLEITVTNFQFADISSLLSKNTDYRIPTDHNGNPLSNDQLNVLLSTVNVKNTGKSDQKIGLYNIVAETNTWANGMDLDLFLSLNGKKASAQPTLSPNKEITVILPFSMYDFQFKKDDWKNIKQDRFKLVLSLYPIKKVVELN